MQEDEVEEEDKSEKTPLFPWWPQAPVKPREKPNKIQRLVESPQFGTFIMLVIIGNTISMMCAYHGMPKQMEDDLFIANLVFTAIFVVEMLLKMVADGFLGCVPLFNQLCL